MITPAVFIRAIGNETACRDCRHGRRGHCFREPFLLGSSSFLEYSCPELVAVRDNSINQIHSGADPAARPEQPWPKRRARGRCALLRNHSWQCFEFAPSRMVPHRASPSEITVCCRSGILNAVCLIHTAHCKPRLLKTCSGRQA